MNENIIVPPLHPLLADRNRAGGVQTQITEKKPLIRVFIVGFFCNYIIFFYGSKGSKHLSGGGGGGGGGVQLFIIFFFFGGGGGSGPPIPLWIRAWVRNK